MREKVLITGASGFLGFHIIEAALKMGLEVHAAIRKSSNIDHLKGLEIQYIYPDFNDIADLKNQIEKNNYQYIIHAAGITKASSLDEYSKVNVTYTYNIAKAAAMLEIPLKKFVFVSSLAAMGPLPSAEGAITEETKPQPVTSYGKSKLMAEEKINGLALPLTIIRPTAIYGPREKDIFILFSYILKGWEPYIGKRKQQLSFVYVKDIAGIVVDALFKNNTSIAFNISDGQSYSRYELADFAKEFLGKKTTRFFLPEGMVKFFAVVLEKGYGLFGKTPVVNQEKLAELTAANWICNIDKASKELDFEPKYNLKSGLEETLVWYKDNKWL
ncbi:NAD-dependent epimerase/dehydratase family protein [Parasediminibacterium sp. JCM 36343]|uniref:NAD-dependent epimerase/dehydratase family protein n=1 Tax=Parasediminibacterium sp. JCM 36343 TaxID=3374279 RepID=UPI0039795D0B